jgi:hypothetical protein
VGSGDIRIGGGETGECDGPNPLPSPRQRDDCYQNRRWREVNYEIRKRLNEGLSILERVKGERTEKEADENREDTRTP